VDRRRLCRWLRKPTRCLPMYLRCACMARPTVPYKYALGTRSLCIEGKQTPTRRRSAASERTHKVLLDIGNAFRSCSTQYAGVDQHGNMAVWAACLPCQMKQNGNNVALYLSIVRAASTRTCYQYTARPRGLYNCELVAAMPSLLYPAAPVPAMVVMHSPCACTP
jgi:hypothetical protein